MPSHPFTTLDDLEPCELAGDDKVQRQRAVILAYSRRSVLRGDPQRLMFDAVSLIGETLSLPLGGTVEPQPNGGWRLQLGGLGAGQQADTHVYPQDPQRSLAAFAMAADRPIASADLGSETRFQDAFLTRSRMVSALMLPLRFEDRLLGAIGLFSQRPHEFSVDEIEFADTIVQLLISTMARLEMSRALEGATKTLAALLESTESIVLITDLDGRVTRVNRAGERISGYGGQDLAGRPFWNALVTSNDLELVRENFQSAGGAGEPRSFETDLLTKHGQRRRIRWSLATMFDEHSSPQSRVFTGVDITDRQQLEQDLLELRQANHRFQQQLGDPSPSPGTATAEPSDGPAAAPQDAGAPFRLIEDGQHATLRSSPRRAYPYRQSVAPIFNDRLPARDQFVEVQFRDISAGGVSFLTSQRPKFETLVLALGFHPNVHYMRARIVNTVETQGETGPLFLVGCKFLERVHL